MMRELVALMKGNMVIFILGQLDQCLFSLLQHHKSYRRLNIAKVGTSPQHEAYSIDQPQYLHYFSHRIASATVVMGLVIVPIPIRAQKCAGSGW